MDPEVWPLLTSHSCTIKSASAAAQDYKVYCTLDIGYWSRLHILCQGFICTSELELQQCSPHKLPQEKTICSPFLFFCVCFLFSHSPYMTAWHAAAIYDCIHTLQWSCRCQRGVMMEVQAATSAPWTGLREHNTQADCLQQPLEGK